MSPVTDWPPRSDPMFETRTETYAVAERATLTLTRLGPVLGLPADAPGVVRDAAEEAVRKWYAESDGRAVLTLPFPVDVVDLLV